jgi:riboflavin kinase / FMN adenylyltransferase
MNVVHGLPQPINELPTILTIGVFDGMHRGHQYLIGSVVRRAREVGYQSAVLTFDPHPDLVVRPNADRLYLTTLDDRIQQIEALGVDLLIILPFTQETMAQRAAEFVQRLCGAVAVRELWAGPDLAVGYRREGTLTRLAELGTNYQYTVRPIEPFLFEGEQVRSTRIRLALEAGRVDQAALLLNRPFAVVGQVVEGDHRGRTIGFPTANLAIGEQLVVPANGVYVCQAEIAGQQYGAVTNIGMRPTFQGTERRVEAYLLDFNGDIYGETVRLSFLARLRGEQKFDGIAALIEQIGKDVAATRAALVR